MQEFYTYVPRSPIDVPPSVLFRVNPQQSGVVYSARDRHGNTVCDVKRDGNMLMLKTTDHEYCPTVLPHRLRHVLAEMRSACQDTAFASIPVDDIVALRALLDTGFRYETAEQGRNGRLYMRFVRDT